MSDFVLRWALAHGQAQVCQHTHVYLSTGDSAMGDLADLDDQLDTLMDAVGKLDFFCINDTTDDALAHDPRLGRVREALQKIFPEPSIFERQTLVECRVSAQPQEMSVV